MQGYTHTPGVLAGSANPYPGVEIVRAVNTSGGVLTAGMVCIHDAASALNVPGRPIPMTTVAGADHPAGAGAVAPNEPTIPAGAEFWMQVSGLHPTVRVDGTVALTAGDLVSTDATAGQAAASGSNPLGRYVDADYSTAAAAAKKIYLLNPLGLAPAY